MYPYGGDKSGYQVVQYVMGHVKISVTMDVYNHVTDQERIVMEITKLDEVQVM